jgi:hypothetical protein
LLKESTHHKEKRSTDFEVADNKEEQAVLYGFVEAVQHLLCTEIEEDDSCNFLEYWHAFQGCRTTFIGIEIEVTVVINF